MYGSRMLNLNRWDIHDPGLLFLMSPCPNSTTRPSLRITLKSERSHDQPVTRRCGYPSCSYGPLLRTASGQPRVLSQNQRATIAQGASGEGAESGEASVLLWASQSQPATIAQGPSRSKRVSARMQTKLFSKTCEDHRCRGDVGAALQRGCCP